MDTTNKYILDVCCGGRMFWFNKQHPNAIYCDIRREPLGVIEQQKGFSVQPDVVCDFRSLPFNDREFKMVIFDPPHAKVNPTSITAKKYGTLSNNWKSDLEIGFKECWRVLDEYGTLVFKWNERQHKLKDFKDILPPNPIVGHPTAKSGATKWVTFMKLPL